MGMETLSDDEEEDESGEVGEVGNCPNLGCSSVREPAALEVDDEATEVLG